MIDPVPMIETKRLKANIHKSDVKIRNLETIVKSMDERIQKLEVSCIAIAEELQSQKK